MPLALPQPPTGAHALCFHAGDGLWIEPRWRLEAETAENCEEGTLKDGCLSQLGINEGTDSLPLAIQPPFLHPAIDQSCHNAVWILPGLLWVTLCFNE